MDKVRIIGGFLVVLVAAQAEHIFPAREGVSWYGSNSVFVGYYAWPPNREPLGVYNGAANQLVEEYDHPDIRCDVEANTCTTRNVMYPWGGLPKNTEVKFGTTGELPGGLSTWKSKTYYISEWSGNTFKLAESPEGPELDLNDSIKGNGKHGMSFAGYSHVMSFRAAVANRISCDPQTDICTSENPHRLKDDSTFFVSSTDRLPSGLRSFWDSRYQKYCLVMVDTTKFQIKQPASYEAPCTNASSKLVDILDGGEGVQYMYAPSVEAVYIRSMTGYPAGTVLTWRRNATVMYAPPYNVATSGGYGSTEPSNFYTTLIAKVPAVTPPGEYQVTVSTSERRATELNPNMLTYILYAVGITPVNKEGPTSYPPIPGLSSSVIPGKPHRSWETLMTSSTNGGGAAMAVYPRCVNRSNPAAPLGWANGQGQPTMSETGTPYPVGYSAPSNARIWFYNNESFFRVAAYTGDPSWTNCSIYIAAAMRDKFLTQGPNSMQGYFYFPWTLVRAYEWTTDPSYKDAVIAIADRGTNFRGEVHDFAMREHAFAFERQLAKRAVTGEANHHLQYFSDAAIAQLYELAIDSPARTFNEPFMLGLAMRPLIKWYKISRDERVPVVIKLILDKLWTAWYDRDKHRFYYNPEPVGLRCTNTGTTENHCSVFTASTLNNLVSPAFAWYWRLTGDDTYRERGDDMFAHVFQDGDPYYAKDWSQVYYWSWDFVAWRKGEQTAVESDGRHMPARRR